MSCSQMILRFAPSPTGFLHIGSARTALFNWLLARHHKGKFLLRIEDTDRVRSTPEAVDAIFQSLTWLGLNWDEEPVFQFSRANRHAEVAHQLVKEGKAYYCYCTPEELETMREEAKAKGLPPRYDGRWRDRDPGEAPQGVKPVVRLKAPQEGETIIEDMVQGTVRVSNEQLDDMVLLRGDGTPTYMLSVVVDDHDMNITHVLRGDDHLTNAFRQTQLFKACGWEVPVFGHIPLIHGPDGAKLSKRHGALGAEQYKEMGFLAETMRNYLVRLGWSHGDEEIFSTEQAIAWFDGQHIGRSPSRLDFQKLTHLNGHYIRQTEDVELLELINPFLKKVALTPTGEERILKGMKGLKERAKTLIELADSALFYIEPLTPDGKALKFCTPEHQAVLKDLAVELEKLEPWSEETLSAVVKAKAEALGIKLGDLAQPLRVALTGRSVSPSLFEVMNILGKEETLRRVRG